tara:strand:- start:789 stop:1223 length:435 start_codon:yes stop_codon:yes gene_type:complete
MKTLIKTKEGYHKKTTWTYVDSACEHLVEELQKDDFIPDLIIGISPDGAIPGALIAQKLAIPRYYASPVDQVANVLSNAITKKCLIVDATMDEKSWSFENNRNVFWSNINYRTAAINFYAHFEPKPDYFAAIVRQDVEVSYPWK